MTERDWGTLIRPFLTESDEPGLWDWSPVLPDWYDPFDAIPVEERDDEPADPAQDDEEEPED